MLIINVLQRPRIMLSSASTLRQKNLKLQLGLPGPHLYVMKTELLENALQTAEFEDAGYTLFVYG